MRCWDTSGRKIISSGVGCGVVSSCAVICMLAVSVAMNSRYFICFLVQVIVMVFCLLV